MEVPVISFQSFISVWLIITIEPRPGNVTVATHSIMRAQVVLRYRGPKWV